jgi:hypothetical protein
MQLIFKKVALLPAVLMIGCAPPMYNVTDHAYVETTSGSYGRKDILITEDQIANAPLYVGWIQNQNWTVFDAQVEGMTDFSDKNFLKAARLMSAEKYAEAYRTLQLLKDTEYDCQVKILKADCLYELKSDTTNFLKRYQEAMDCSSNAQVKSIAQIRFRFIKYGI